MDEVFVNPELIKLLATIAASVLLVVISLIIASYGTNKIVMHLISAWVIARAKLDVVIDAVDEPTDPVNVQIDTMLDKFMQAEWGKYSAVFLPVFLRALADGLDTVVAPPQETITPPKAPETN